MSKQVNPQDNLDSEIIADVSGFYINDIDQELKLFVDENPKAAILCKIKEKNPNYLSIIYANKLFYDFFSINESNVIGKSYDFLFDDFDIGYASENQLEYIRLVKAVKDIHACSIVADLHDYSDSLQKIKFKIDYTPNTVEKVYSTFTFEKVEVIGQQESKSGEVLSSNDLGTLKNLERTLNNERLLREIGYLIVSDLPIQEVAKNVSKILCQYLKADRCLIHNYRNGNTTFVAEHASESSPKMFKDSQDQTSIKVLTDYINFQNRFHQKFDENKGKKNSLIAIDDVKSDQSFMPIEKICEEFSIASQISIITSLNNKVNGGIYIHQGEKRSWMIDEIELISMIADQFSLAVDRSDSIERVMVANHELLEKTQQLKEALKEEKNIRKMQNEFIALVSHEFKTPLQIIDSTRELVVRKLKTLNVNDESLSKSLDKIKSGIQRMNGLIHSTLNLAKMESGVNTIKVEKQSFDLKKFIEEIVEKNSNLATNKGIVVEMNIDNLPESFNGDPKLLDHSFTNIVSNAIKYSKNNTTVKIVSSIDEKQVTIKTTDQGIGIPKEDLANIGQKFFRAKNTLAVAGTGIGLYLTKYFIEL
ncbi:MAG: GAF domain-containing sensor histidine kinase, partial [Pelagibacterales bacterium]|nr:GAF domain-containing sensor histidine kinase [Pelagibacterales bacterium]